MARELPAGWRRMLRRSSNGSSPRSAATRPQSVALATSAQPIRRNHEPAARTTAGAIGDLGRVCIVPIGKRLQCSAHIRATIPRGPCQPTPPGDWQTPHEPATGPMSGNLSPRTGPYGTLLNRSIGIATEATLTILLTLRCGQAAPPGANTQLVCKLQKTESLGDLGSLASR